MSFPDFDTKTHIPSSSFELLIDATSCGISSKRRFESKAQSLNDLLGEICFELSLSNDKLTLEVWDNEFEEWVLLTDVSKQIPQKAKVRILVDGGHTMNNEQVNSPPPPSQPNNGLDSKTILPPNVPFSNLHQLDPSSSSVMKNNLKKSGRIQVENYCVNFGLDLKFQDDPDQGISPKNLHGMLTKQEFRTSIAKINQEIAGSRATNVDLALLASGTMLIPLIPFGIRNYRHKKAYKKHLLIAINDFNIQHPKLKMRWLTRPISQLVIDWAEEEEEEEESDEIFKRNTDQSNHSKGVPKGAEEEGTLWSGMLGDN